MPPPHACYMHSYMLTCLRVDTLLATCPIRLSFSLSNNSSANLLEPGHKPHTHSSALQGWHGSGEPCSTPLSTYLSAFPAPECPMTLFTADSADNVWVGALDLEVSFTFFPLSRSPLWWVVSVKNERRCIWRRLVVMNVRLHCSLFSV